MYHPSQKFSNPLVTFSCLLATILLFNCSTTKQHKLAETRVLVFSKTNGFRHSSIPAGIAALQKIGVENNFLVDFSEDSLVFNYSNLKKYKTIIFLQTTGNILGDEEEKAFTKYIQQGGGFVGIHAASDCEYGWPWYVKLIGGNFLNHPKTQNAKLEIINHTHPSTKMLPKTWVKFDEWYNFKNLNPDVTVLIKVDEKSYTGGTNGDHHPIAWYHSYDGGRVFYTELGHTNESYSDLLFLQHVTGGIKYALSWEK